MVRSPVVGRLPGGIFDAVGWVAVGSMLANVCAYAVHLGAGRWWLTPAEYGELAVALSAQLVLTVPALALQAVVAREVVHGRDDLRIRALTLRCSLAVAVLAVIAVPVVSAVASTSWTLTAAGLAAAPLLTVVGGGQGVLQGRRRFRTLGVVLAAVGVVRSAPTIAALAAGAGPTGALLAGTVGTAVAAAVVWGLAGARMPAGSGASGAGLPGAGLSTVVRASQVQLVLVVAVSLDVLLSRTVLDPRDAGVYAFGAIATKVAFWLPQAVGVVFYPQLADPASSGRSLRQAVGVVAGIGLVITVLGALAGPLLPVLIGDDYRQLTDLLGLFAFTGAAFAVLQVALLAAIAHDRTRISVLAWLFLAIEAAAILLLGHSVIRLAVIAAVAATVSAVTTTIVALRFSHRTPDRRASDGAVGRRASDGAAGDRRPSAATDQGT
ncbi:polysaccharide biosynthesis protein [Gordonia sputi]|nr:MULTISPECIES: polysaccharide biosynthesis protein [Gordonia]MCM3894530.1 polysaccharide biosynthesis protein [Gordonia sputi]